MILCLKLYFVVLKVSIKENEEEEGLMIDTSAGSVKAQAQVENSV